jgi:hypothetical protein
MTTDQLKAMRTQDIETFSDREILVLLWYRVAQIEEQLQARATHIWNILGGAALVVLTFVLTKWGALPTVCSGAPKH